MGLIVVPAIDSSKGVSAAGWLLQRPLSTGTSSQMPSGYSAPFEPARGSSGGMYANGCCSDAFKFAELVSEFRERVFRRLCWLTTTTWRGAEPERRPRRRRGPSRRQYRRPPEPDKSVPRWRARRSDSKRKRRGVQSRRSLGFKLPAVPAKDRSSSRKILSDGWEVQ